MAKVLYLPTLLLNSSFILNKTKVYYVIINIYTVNKFLPHISTTTNNTISMSHFY